MSADIDDICPECGSVIPMDAPMGMCTRCLAEELASDFPLKRPKNNLDTGMRRLDAYEIKDQIGEGGFGVVYRAQQREPFEREVALKVLRPWLDSPGILARFEAERQALALLDHPNIAAIYDAGKTEDGRPWFAMEYVAGQPLTRFCVDEGLDTVARLKVFRDVCGAVSHAHQRGIIHRDLKPSNILVMLRNGTPVVKLIDFGIAKATQHVLTDSALLTGTHQSLGTPAYMSPEQASSGGVDVDTRTDVYALGVILYELLTNQAPKLPASSGKSGRPALKVARDIQVASDLDWIVLKATEEEPGRRYASVADFSADLDRYSAKEPVLARPPSVGYKLYRFVSRNRFWVAAASLLAVSIICGALISFEFAIKADRARAETRRVASLSDLRMASEAAEDARFADCVASLTRALRTDPDNVTAFWKLANELAYRGYIPPVEEPVVLESGVEEVAALTADWQLVRDRRGIVWLCQGGSHRDIGRADKISASGDGRHFSLMEGSRVRWYAMAENGDARELGSADAERVFFLEDNIMVKNGTMCVAHSLTKSEIVWELDLRYEPVVLSDAGGHRLVTGNQSGFVQVFSGRTGRLLASADAGMRPRTLSTNGRSVVVLMERGDLLFWRPDKGLGFVGDTIDRMRTDVVMDETGRRIAVLRLDGSLELWRIEGDEMIAVAKNVSFSGGVNRAVFDKSGDYLGAISRDGRVHVIGSDSGEPVGEFVFHSRRVTDVSALPDGSGLVTANEDGLVYRFSTKRRTAEPKVDRAVGAELLYADFSPPGNSINLVDVDKRCHVWRYPSGSAYFPSFRFPDGQLALDSGDKSEILFHKDGEVFLMIVHNWFEQSPHIVIEGGVASGRVSRDLKRALIGTNEGAASLVSIWNAKEIHRWREFGEKVNVAAMTKDGKKGAIASGGSICVVSLEPPFDVIARCEHGGEIRWLDIDADGRVLASGSTDNTACLWDLSTGKRIGPKLKHAEYAGGDEYPARGVFGVFSLGGKRLVTTGSPDRTARVWDTGTGEAAIDPLLHDSLVTCVDISSDERWVATGTESGEASLWDVATGEKIAPSWGREVPVLSVALHPEDNVLMIAWKDGVCRTLALVPSDLECEDWFLDFADSLAGRRFNDRDVLESVTAAEVLNWQDRISEAGKSEELKKFAFWLVATDRERHPFPF